MNKLISDIKFFFQNKRGVMIVLLPFVIIGVFLLYQKNNSKTIYAVDPLVVTYNGGPPPLPMFVVTGMLPGDETEKVFNVKNDGPDPETVLMDAVKTTEVKLFAQILDVEVAEVGSLSLLFSGKLQAFFDSPLLNLGNFPAGVDKNFRVKVKFPFDAGDEYQEALVKFNLIWSTEGSDTNTPTPPTITPPLTVTPTPGGSTLPDECKILEGKIFSVIEGTEEDDKLHGDTHNNLIFARGGNDKIDASSGDDCIVLGEGDDEVDADSGNDIILGGGGNDKIESGNGNDTIWGGEGNDNIDGGSGNDLIYGEGGNDDLDGDDNDDELYGGVGDDTLRGGSGTDKLYGEEGNDNLHAGSGNDHLDGGADTDNLHGNSGTDTCINGESQNSCEL